MGYPMSDTSLPRADVPPAADSPEQCEKARLLVIKLRLADDALQRATAAVAKPPLTSHWLYYASSQLSKTNEWLREANVLLVDLAEQKHAEDQREVFGCTEQDVNFQTAQADVAEAKGGA